VLFPASGRSFFVKSDESCHSCSLGRLEYSRVLNHLLWFDMSLFYQLSYQTLRCELLKGLDSSGTECPGSHSESGKLSPLIKLLTSILSHQMTIMSVECDFDECLGGQRPKS
jgi:hypothetical protein